MRQGVCTKSPDGVVATSGRELRFIPITSQHNGVFEFVPYLLVEATHLAAQCLDLLWITACQNLLALLLIAK